MKNLIGAYEDPTRTYWTVLEYSSPLSEEDRKSFELDFISERETWYRKDL